MGDFKSFGMGDRRWKPFFKNATWVAMEVHRLVSINAGPNKDPLPLVLISNYDSKNEKERGLLTEFKRA
jgi:hypothetical protein